MAVKKNQQVGVDVNDPKNEPPETRRVRVGHDRAIVNGHVLRDGDVIELSDEDINQHRRNGIALHDVAEDEEVADEDCVDVSEPYVAQDEDDNAA